MPTLEQLRSTLEQVSSLPAPDLWNLAQWNDRGIKIDIQVLHAYNEEIVGLYNDMLKSTFSSVAFKNAVILVLQRHIKLQQQVDKIVNQDNPGIEVDL
jgi:hypothetical protein